MKDIWRQIELIEPRVVATLGNFATKLLSGRPTGITRVHGQEQEVTLGGRRVLLYPIYHPAAALYTPRMLEVLKDDFARLPEVVGREVARRARLRRPVAAEPAVQLGLFDRNALAGRDGRGCRQTRSTFASRRRRDGLGSARLRQDDLRARCVPRTRCRGSGHEPDVHDRTSLQGTCRRVASRPLSLQRRLGSGVGRPRAILRRRHCLRRMARGGRRRPSSPRVEVDSSMATKKGSGLSRFMTMLILPRTAMSRDERARLRRRGAGRAHLTCGHGARGRVRLAAQAGAHTVTSKGSPSASARAASPASDRLATRAGSRSP